MQIQQETSVDSSTPVDSVTNESTVIVVRSAEEDDKANKVLVENAKTYVSESPEKHKHTCVIDIKCDCGILSNENWDGEKVCRICHLSSSDCPSSENLDLIQLGCGCKDELGSAHRHCGEAWFKLKGNRCCEICGEAAKNITGVGDNRFMEEWNETSDGNSGNSSEVRRGFFRGKPLCNFLMGCLVIAFVLPWFFRVNMF